MVSLRKRTSIFVVFLGLAATVACIVTLNAYLNRECLNSCPDWSVKTIHRGKEITCLSFSPGGDKLVSSNVGRKDPLKGEIAVWKLPSCERLFSSHESDQINAAVFSPAGDVVAFGGRGPNICFMESDSFNTKSTLIGNESYISELIFTPDGKKLVSNGSDIVVWDLVEKRELFRWSDRNISICGLAISPDGKTLALAGAGYTSYLALWDLENRHIHVELKSPDKEGKGYSCVGFSPDGKTLAIAFAKPVIALWDLQTRSVKAYLQGHSRYITSVIFMSDSILASVCGDLRKPLGPGELIFWDVKKGNMLKKIVAHKTGIRCLAKSPNGKYLATGGYDGCIIIWDLEKILAELKKG